MKIRQLDIKKKRTGSDKIEFIISTFVFRILIDTSYKMIIVKQFAYTGFKGDQNVLLFLFSYLLLFGFSVMIYEMKVNKSSIAKEVIYIFYLLSIIPFTTVMAFGNLTVEFTAANTLFWILLIAYYKCLPRRRIRFKLWHGFNGLSQKAEDWLLKGFLLVFFLVIVYISGRYTGFRINLNLLKVYELRSEAKLYAVPTFLRYLFSWSRAINTIFITYYCRQKKYLLVGIAFFLQILSFGIDGSKSVFFFALCALAINIFPRINLSKINKYALYFLSGITLTGIIFYKMTGSYFIVSLFNRRLMLLPVQLGQNYFTFFTTNTPDYYRGSFLKYFGIKTPYPDLAYLIGKTFYNQPTMGANNGLISDAITNMGLIGIILEPLLIVWILRALDNSSKGLDVRIYITAALYAGIVLLNSFVPVALLTHGILVVILVLSMMRRTNGFIKTGRRLHG